MHVTVHPLKLSKSICQSRASNLDNVQLTLVLETHRPFIIAPAISTSHINIGRISLEQNIDEH